MGGILESFNECKEAWLNNKRDNKDGSSDFSILAEKMSLATHVCKFSHPSAKTSPIISRYSYKNDGYLHSGNVECDLDIIRNADLSKFAKFLLVKMNDRRTVIEHLGCDSQEIRLELSFLKEEYDNYRMNFLKAQKDNQELMTDERVKQVYFPVGDTYHLLSLLTPSGMITSVKSKIEDLRKKANNCKNEKNEDYGNDYDEIYDLTVINFGGTKPQNISALNSKNMYLLASCPPTILERRVTRPRRDFFSSTLQLKKFKSDFEYLHKLFKCDRNNLAVRNKIKETLNAIIDKVMSHVYGLREIEAGWSAADSHSQLPTTQKIWLDNMYVKLLENKDAWFDEISDSFARWIMTAYEKTLRNNRILLGDDELAFFQSRVEAVLLQDEESPV